MLGGRLAGAGGPLGPRRHRRPERLLRKGSADFSLCGTSPSSWDLLCNAVQPVRAGSNANRWLYVRDRYAAPASRRFSATSALSFAWTVPTPEIGAFTRPSTPVMPCAEAGQNATCEFLLARDENAASTPLVACRWSLKNRAAVVVVENSQNADRLPVQVSGGALGLNEEIRLLRDQLASKLQLQMHN
jgi:hypothetical protein